MFKKIYKRLIKGIFTKEYWVSEFPSSYPPECFDCRKMKCLGCEYLHK